MDRKDRKKNKRGIWNETGRNKFREVIRGIGDERERENSTGGELMEGIERIKEGIEECEKEEAVREKRGWWDKECKEEKEEARSKMRKWKKGKERVEDYRKAKKEYKKVCDRKKKEEEEEWVKKAENAKTDGSMGDNKKGEKKKKEDKKGYRDERMEGALHGIVRRS